MQSAGSPTPPAPRPTLARRRESLSARTFSSTRRPSRRRQRSVAPLLLADGARQHGRVNSVDMFVIEQKRNEVLLKDTWRPANPKDCLLYTSPSPRDS